MAGLILDYPNTPIAVLAGQVMNGNLLALYELHDALLDQEGQEVTYERQPATEALSHLTFNGQGSIKTLVASLAARAHTNEQADFISQERNALGWEHPERRGELESHEEAIHPDLAGPFPYKTGEKKKQPKQLARRFAKEKPQLPPPYSVSKPYVPQKKPRTFPPNPESPGETKYLEQTGQLETEADRERASWLAQQKQELATQTEQHRISNEARKAKQPAPYGRTLQEQGRQVGHYPLDPKRIGIALYVAETPAGESLSEILKDIGNQYIDSPIGHLAWDVLDGNLDSIFPLYDALLDQEEHEANLPNKPNKGKNSARQHLKNLATSRVEQIINEPPEPNIHHTYQNLVYAIHTEEQREDIKEELNKTPKGARLPLHEAHGQAAQPHGPLPPPPPMRPSYEKRAFAKMPMPQSMGLPVANPGQMAATSKQPEMDPTHEAYLAFSPSTEENLSFETAYARSRSGNQKAFQKITDHVLGQIGLKGKSHNAVGDWEDGAENSVLQIIDNPHDPEQMRYAAAWYGLLGNQRAVLHFRPDNAGRDSVYNIKVPETRLDQIRSQLSKVGIPFRTLVPGRNGTQIVVYDQGRQWRDNIGQFAGIYNAPVNETLGSGEYIGGSTRTAARAKYRSIIKAYESRTGAKPDAVRAFRPPVRVDSGGAPSRFARESANVIKMAKPLPPVVTDAQRRAWLRQSSPYYRQWLISLIKGRVTEGGRPPRDIRLLARAVLRGDFSAMAPLDDALEMAGLYKNMGRVGPGEMDPSAYMKRLTYGEKLRASTPSKAQQRYMNEFLAQLPQAQIRSDPWGTEDALNESYFLAGQEPNKPGPIFKGIPGLKPKLPPKEA
jgi:hypothetical protein